MIKKKKSSPKSIVVSSKTAEQVFKNFERAPQKVQRGAFRGKAERELSFDNNNAFKSFTQNITQSRKKKVGRYKTADEFAKSLGGRIKNIIAT